jgi:anti-sigma B factor antagonist
MTGRFACVRTVPAEGLVALLLSGELDIETVPVLEAEIERVLADAPATVVLDLPGLEFLDSTGLRAILEAQERLRNQGTQLVLTHARRTVQLTFVITGLDAHLSFIDNLAQLTGKGPGK